MFVSSGNTQNSYLIFYLFRSRWFSKVALLSMNSNVREMSSSIQKTVKSANYPSNDGRHLRISLTSLIRRRHWNSLTDLPKQPWFRYRRSSSIKIKYLCFLSELFIFICGFFAKLFHAIFAFKKAKEKLSEINSFRVKKTTISSTYLTRAGNFWTVDIGINAWSTLSLNLEIKQCFFSSCH